MERPFEGKMEGPGGLEGTYMGQEGLGDGMEGGGGAGGRNGGYCRDLEKKNNKTCSKTKQNHIF